MRRFLAPMVIVGVMVMALPVSAAESVSGESKMTLHGRAEPCTNMSWVGTLDVSGSGDTAGTYGLALQKKDDLPASQFIDGWWRWAEYFTVYDQTFEVDDEGLIVDCEPGTALLHGYDSGVGLPDGDFWDTGYIIEAAGPFEGLEGAKADQLGTFTVFSDTKTTPDGKPFPVGFETTFTVE